MVCIRNGVHEGVTLDGQEFATRHAAFGKSALWQIGEVHLKRTVEPWRFTKGKEYEFVVEEDE
jgi:hypothetical protein